MQVLEPVLVRRKACYSMREGIEVTPRTAKTFLRIRFERGIHQVLHIGVLRSGYPGTQVFIWRIDILVLRADELVILPYAALEQFLVLVIDLLNSLGNGRNARDIDSLSFLNRQQLIAGLVRAR